MKLWTTKMRRYLVLVRELLFIVFYSLLFVNYLRFVIKGIISFYNNRAKRQIHFYIVKVLEGAHFSKFPPLEKEGQGGFINYY